MVCWEIIVGWGQVSGVLGNHCGVGSGGSCVGVSLLGSGEWCVWVSLWDGVRCVVGRGITVGWGQVSGGSGYHCGVILKSSS